MEHQEQPRNSKRSDLERFRVLRAPAKPEQEAEEPQVPTPPAVIIEDRNPGLTEALENAERASQISESHRINPILARVLAQRGFEPGATTEEFLRPSLNSLPSPTLLKGSRRFCEILSGAARSNGKVGIIHDYDVDGTMAATILSSALEQIGIRHKLLPPDRNRHGYGVHPELVKQAAAKGCTVLACLDLGTTNHESLVLARKLGMKVIVIDHHEMKPRTVRSKKPSPPPADAFMNPHRAGCGFAGEICCAAALTWFAVCRLKEHLLTSRRAKSRKRAAEIDTRELLGCAALATVADVVPLTGVNRVIVRHGLPALEQSHRLGVKKLLDHAGVKGTVRASDVAFKIAPRINAAGRMIDEATTGAAGAATVTKLFSTDKLKRAEQLADSLNRNNQIRKETEGKMVTEVESMMRTLGELPDGIVLWGEDFHPGVIGLGAARIAERYYRPTLCFQIRPDGKAKCSARGGVKGFSVIEAFRALEAEVGRDVLLEYGGHDGAGGAAVHATDLPTIRTAWNKVCGLQLERLGRSPRVKPDLELTLQQFTEHGVEFVQQLDLLEPCGAANPQTKFVVRGVRVVAATIIKGRHLELMIQQRDERSGKVSYASAILWHRSDHPALTRSGTRGSPLHNSRTVPPQDTELVDIVCHPQVDQRNRHNPDKSGLFLQVIAAQIVQAVPVASS